MPCIVFLSTGDPSSRPNADDNFDSFAASKCHPRFCNCFFRDACLAARRFCRLDGPRSLITFTPKPSFPSVLLRCYAYCQAAAYHGGNSNFGMVHPWRRITLVPIEGLEYVEEAVTALGSSTELAHHLFRECWAAGTGSDVDLCRAFGWEVESHKFKVAMSWPPVRYGRVATASRARTIAQC